MWWLYLATRTTTQSRTMSSPSRQCYLWPPVTMNFDLLTSKVDRFTPLLCGSLVPICIKISQSVSKYSTDTLSNGCYECTGWKQCPDQQLWPQRGITNFQNSQCPSIESMPHIAEQRWVTAWNTSWDDYIKHSFMCRRNTINTNSINSLHCSMMSAQAGHPTCNMTTAQAGHLTCNMTTAQAGHLTCNMTTAQAGHLTCSVTSAQAGHLTCSVTSAQTGHLTCNMMSAQAGHLTCNMMSAQTGHLTCSVMSAQTGHLTCNMTTAQTGHLTCNMMSAQTGHLTCNVTSAQAGHLTCSFCRCGLTWCDNWKLAGYTKIQQ